LSIFFNQREKELFEEEEEEEGVKKFCLKGKEAG
jgi:hypothetical protein